MTRLLLRVAALALAFIAGAIAQANWPIEPSWEDTL